MLPEICSARTEGFEAKPCLLQWRTTPQLKAALGTLLDPSRDLVPDYGAPNDHVTASACPELDIDRFVKTVC